MYYKEHMYEMAKNKNHINELYTFDDRFLREW